MRSPLNSIVLGLHLLLESPKLTVDEQDTVIAMQEASASMSSTLNEFMSMQQIDQGNEIVLDCANFRPMKVMSSVAITFKNQSDEKNLRIQVESTPGAPTRYVCMCMCVCIYVYVYVHLCVCVYVHLCVCVWGGHI